MVLSICKVVADLIFWLSPPSMSSRWSPTGAKMVLPDGRAAEAV